MLMSRYLVFKKLLAFVAFALVLCSCGGEEKKTARNAGANDSTTLTIAVFPSLDALPLMLANDWGVLDSLGVAANFKVYRSQMDCEKTLTENNADVALTDIFRVAWWQWQKKPVRFAFSTRREMAIVPNKALRISSINRLDDRMIAMSRFSLDDYYCDKVIKLITKRKGQILKAQINSVELRAKMLCSGQFDAAILSQMQLYKVKAAGFKPLTANTELAEGFAGFAFNMKSFATDRKRTQMLKLQRAYDIVVERLGRNATMPGIEESTRQAMFLDAPTMEKINAKRDFMKATAAKSSLITEATAWLKEIGAVGREFNSDTLVVDNR